MIDKHITKSLEPNNCYNIDCEIGMRLMKEQGLKADWCITDPPYGIGIDGQIGGANNAKLNGYEKKNWDNERIEKRLFDLIFETSQNQVLFGGNYYTDILPPTKSWCIWDKRCGGTSDNFADCEMAWCSKGQARIVHYLYRGMIEGDMKGKAFRFHPTQKPLQMWIKILTLYTKEGDLILDPFAGSQSLRIACHKTNRRYIGFEIDRDYYEKGCKWFENESMQLTFF